MTTLYVPVHYRINGIPDNTLSPTACILRLSDDVEVKTDVACALVGKGWYKYTFADADDGEQYVATFDAGSSVPNVERYAPGIPTATNEGIKAKTDLLPSGISKNTALSDFEFLMISASDHITPATLLAVSGQISKDGGAFAALTNVVAEVSNGVYKVDLTAAELNADVVTLIFTAVGADQRTITIKTST
jgi:hypothetical protein